MHPATAPPVGPTAPELEASEAAPPEPPATLADFVGLANDSLARDAFDHARFERLRAARPDVGRYALRDVESHLAELGGTGTYRFESLTYDGEWLLVPHGEGITACLPAQRVLYADASLRTVLRHLFEVEPKAGGGGSVEIRQACELARPAGDGAFHISRRGRLAAPTTLLAPNVTGASVSGDVAPPDPEGFDEQTAAAADRELLRKQMSQEVAAELRKQLDAWGDEVIREVQATRTPAPDARQLERIHETLASLSNTIAALGAARQQAATDDNALLRQEIARAVAVALEGQLDRWRDVGVSAAQEARAALLEVSGQLAQVTTALLTLQVALPEHRQTLRLVSDRLEGQDRALRAAITAALTPLVERMDAFQETLAKMQNTLGQVGANWREVPLMAAGALLAEEPQVTAASEAIAGATEYPRPPLSRGFEPHPMRAGETRRLASIQGLRTSLDEVKIPPAQALTVQLRRTGAGLFQISPVDLPGWTAASDDQGATGRIFAAVRDASQEMYWLWLPLGTLADSWFPLGYRDLLVTPPDGVQRISRVPAPAVLRVESATATSGAARVLSKMSVEFEEADQ